MATTNKKMTLEYARMELEHHGFSCHDVFASNQDSVLVGVSSQCRWSMSARMDTMVFVHQLVDIDLTRDKLEADLDELPDLIQRYYVGGCPVFGVSRGIMVIVVYLTNQRIEPSVLLKLMAEPEWQWCMVTFLAAQDGDGISHFLEQTTPYWGRALYPELRYWAGLMTGRGSTMPPSPPAMSRWIVFSSVYPLFVIVGINTGLTGMGAFLLWLSVVTLIATLIQWFRQNQHSARRGRHKTSLSMQRIPLNEHIV